MSKEAAPPLGFDAGTASDGSLALATEESAGEEKSSSPQAGPLPPPRPGLATLEGLAPMATEAPVVREFDDPTNPDEAEWELTSELRAKPLPSQTGGAPTLPSPGARSSEDDLEALVPKRFLDDDDDDDDDLDDSDLTSVYVRPEGDDVDYDDDWNDDETAIVAPMASDAAPTAPRQLPPLLSLGPARSVPPPPPRSTRGPSAPAPGRPALGLLTRPGSVLPPPPPVGTAARTSPVPAGLLGMVTRPAAAPPPPPGSASALPPPPGALAGGSLRPPPPLGALRPPSIPPPPGGALRTGVPAPPTARSNSSIPPAPPKSAAFPPPPSLPTLPRASAPPPPLTAPPARTSRLSDRPVVASPFAVEALKAPVARPSAPPRPPPGSSIAPVAIGRGSAPSSPFAVPPRRFAQLGAIALLAIGLLGAGVTLVAKRGSSAAAGGDGVLTVTVAGEGNRPVSDLTVVADDVVRCTASPCRISSLAAGTHFVRVTAEGYTATAARAVSVSSSGDSSLHFQLSLIPTPVALDTREPEKPAAQATPKPTIDLDADEAASTPTPRAEAPARVREYAPSSRRAAASSERAEPKPERQEAKPVRESPSTSSLKAALAEQVGATPAAPAVEEQPAAPTAMSTLNINSTPSTNIVLDGRPLGKTPISGVKVKPGAHTIVFIGPDGKRKVGSASIKPGATRTIGVKF